MQIEAILAERKTTHGDYSTHAGYSQDIKLLMKRSENWSDMTDHQRETLEMIAHKIARILAGDHTFDDHWRDIAGYATLTAARLKKEPAK